MAALEIDAQLAGLDALDAALDDDCAPPHGREYRLALRRVVRHCMDRYYVLRPYPRPSRSARGSRVAAWRAATALLNHNSG